MEVAEQEAWSGPAQAASTVRRCPLTLGCRQDQQDRQETPEVHDRGLHYSRKAGRSGARGCANSSRGHPLATQLVGRSFPLYELPGTLWQTCMQRRAQLQAADEVAAQGFSPSLPPDPTLTLKALRASESAATKQRRALGMR